MRGSGEGFRPYDLKAWVDDDQRHGRQSGRNNGGIAIVKYGNEEKKSLIPDDVPVVSFEPTDRSALKAGAKVIVNGERCRMAP